MSRDPRLEQIFIHENKGFSEIFLKYLFFLIVLIQLQQKFYQHWLEPLMKKPAIK